MKPRTLLTLAVIVLFAAFLTYSTLSAQKVTCTVCVAYNGGSRCSPASGKNEEEASRTAQSTACGPLTSGMNDAIACGRLIPTSQNCQKK